MNGWSLRASINHTTVGTLQEQAGLLHTVIKEMAQQLA